MKASFPFLVARPVQALDPTTLRITYGHQGKVESPRSRGRAFHLTAEEAWVATDVVSGMYSFIILSS